VIRRAADWLRRARPAPESDADTLAERRLQALGRGSTEVPLLERLRALEQDLRKQERRLRALPADELPALQRAAVLRGQIQDFLREPDGGLATALLQWTSPADAAAHHRLEQMLGRGELLWGQVYEFLDFGERLAQARERLDGLARRFRDALPQMWQGAAAHLTPQLARVAARREVDVLLRDLDCAEASLGAHSRALAELETALLEPGRLRIPEDRRQHLAALPDREQAVRLLLDLAEEQGREGFVAAVARLQR
jgi:hypothetical protein